MSFNKICVVGLGYIGLPTAIILADHNKNVIGFDVNPEVVKCVNEGKLHIAEPELDTKLQEVVKQGKLIASTEVQKADVYVIAVPTPFKEDNEPDISYVEQAIISIAPHLEEDNLIILESTSPVGTTEKMSQLLSYINHDFSKVDIAYCPERVLPGNIVHELIHNDRIVGGIRESATKRAKEFYQIFVKGNIAETDSKTAELAKLTENSFRDVNIAFANELSIICDKLDINVLKLIELSNMHPRVNILKPGCGVGGHCIAVDPWFIVDSAKEEAKLIKMARDVNDSKPDWVVNKISEKANNILAIHPSKSNKDIKIACLGISYKPDSDDMRNSPALEIVKKLDSIGFSLCVVAKHKASPNDLRDDLYLSLEEALEFANIVCILVNDKEFIEKKDHISKHYCVLDIAGIL